jgi:hypothetical protein
VVGRIAADQVPYLVDAAVKQAVPLPIDYFVGFIKPLELRLPFPVFFNILPVLA